MAIFGRRKAAIGIGETRSASADAIARLAPFEHLESNQVAKVAAAARIVPLGARTRITAEPGVSNFLHRGRIKLSHDDRPAVQLDHGDPGSAFALPVDPAWRIQTVGPVELLSVPARFQVLAPSQPADQDLLDWLREQAEDPAYQDFYHALKGNRCELPSLPDLARRIGAAIDDQNTASEDIARVIQSDPSLAARVMGVVNSPAYRGRDTIQSLPQAVSRLGRDQIRSLVFSFLVKAIFRTDSALLKERMRSLWAHSCHVGAIAAVLASKTPGLDPERALLAGLVHDIGVVPILARAREYPELLKDAEALDRVVRGLRGETGSQTLRQWGFDREFVDIAARAEDWMRTGDAVPDYLDVVLLAQLHAMIGTARMASLPRIDQVPAFRKLAGGGLTPQGSMAVIEQAANDIRALRQLLESP